MKIAQTVSLHALIDELGAFSLDASACYNPNEERRLRFVIQAGMEK
jgi:hypothetical protein